MASAQAIRGLKATLNSSGRFKYKGPEAAVDFLVCFSGVVGLAIAQRLTLRFPNKTVYLVERHSRAGEETSSRNSEVIHAGLYYPPNSLKTRLCLRGRHLMYERCNAMNIPFKKTGKLVVAHKDQIPYIEGLLHKSQQLSWPLHSSIGSLSEAALPTKIISGDEAREMEPDLSKDIAAALWSPETGIVDSHALMDSLEKDIAESENGELVYSTDVVRVDPCKSGGSILGEEAGWIVQTVTNGAEESDAMLARTLINASGLSSNLILNSLLSEQYRVPMFFGKGSYATYSGPGVSRVSHLIYPCPDTRGSKHAFQSLGTHLTLDLDGKVRFGPDLEWLPPPADESDGSFWRKHLIPSNARMRDMYEAVKFYLTDVTFEGFSADYAGIRPKLATSGFQDFVIRSDFADGNNRGRMVSLMGIESPGLTSSLAIAEHIMEDVLGLHGSQ
ncbi:NAD dehydrogenase [Coniophora puteana RWD-64-598 SS2]|uniref:L-2-hydroxyglutarate dehydrogenase, mitochondrial n=1 Tax=Coniophora puteana (strain RWD-64-598) TaxID=741705 RepID=A0A5M3MUS3_CONPW|nr:NAD dehydrogenase [Coniophora puteana RWD-64-598 SS2]EIW82504.1 NAD dehydrogenase [Coniophora puteana RWD-64-598 SS2]